MVIDEQSKMWEISHTFCVGGVDVWKMYKSGLVRSKHPLYSHGLRP